MLSAESSKVVIAVVPEGAQTAPFEVLVERITMDPSKGDESLAYRMLELWTEGRLYIIDTNFTCIEVVDRKTRQTDPNHAFLNARLIGGQRREGSSTHLIKPFPLVGTSAVFEKGTGTGQPKLTQVTSKVQRVVLRIRVSTVNTEPSMAMHSSGSIKLPPI